MKGRAPFPAVKNSRSILRDARKGGKPFSLHGACQKHAFGHAGTKRPQPLHFSLPKKPADKKRDDEFPLPSKDSSSRAAFESSPARGRYCAAAIACVSALMASERSLLEGEECITLFRLFIASESLVYAGWL